MKGYRIHAPVVYLGEVLAFSRNLTAFVVWLRQTKLHLLANLRVMQIIYGAYQVTCINTLILSTLSKNDVNVSSSDIPYRFSQHTWCALI